VPQYYQPKRKIEGAPAQGPRVSSRLRRGRAVVRLAGLVVVVSLSAMIAGWVARQNAVIASDRLDALGKRLIERIGDRFQDYQNGLLWASSAISRGDGENGGGGGFGPHRLAQGLVRVFPGARSLGFVRVVRPEQREEFVARVRKEGQGAFEIKALMPHDGDSYIIEDVDPREGHSEAIGFDIASSDSLRATAEAAVESGKATLTAPIQSNALIGTAQDGALLMLPVFRRASPVETEQQRRAALIGWTYMEVAIDELLQSFVRADRLFEFSLADEGHAPFYVSTSDRAGDERVRRTTIDMYGRSWDVEWWAKPEFVTSLGLHNPVSTFVISLIMSMMIAALIEMHLSQSDRRLERDVERARLAAIVEGSCYAIVAKSVDGTIMSWNKSAERMFGYTAAQAMGQNASELLVPDELWDEEQRMLSSTQDGRSFGYVWTKRKKANGELLDVAIAISPMRSDDGSLIGLSWTARDITDLVEAEREIHDLNASLERQVAERTAQLERTLTLAEQASAAKADFLANMSHEIRTPLNGIIGYADLVLEDETLAPKTRRQVERIFEASDALRVIIDDILDFSKIEACGVKLENKPLYINELIENCASIIKPKADEKGLELIITFCDTPHVLIGDAARLRQVVLNLMNNAVKFTSAGSVELVVSCLSRTHNSARLRIAVTDTGIGISEDEQKALFKRFSQADETISRKYGGTGLGLAISQRIVQAMHSELKIDSKPGVGSTLYFEVDLPIAERIEIVRHERPVRSSRRARILVVDDVEMNRDLCKTMLTRDGHEVDLADGGPSAIAMSGSRAYDIIFMDVQMGEMDGLEATRQIRALGGELCDVPIIALTANVLPEQVARYRAAGMDDHLGKPINRAELLSCVAKWIDGVPYVESVPLAPGSAARDGAPPVHDLAALEELRLFASGKDIDGFAAKLRDTLAWMRANWPQDMDIAGLDAASRETLGRAAHKTVSLAGQLGFSELAAACRRMAAACEPDKDLPDAFAALHAAIDNAAAEFEVVMHSAEPGSGAA
jgi:PAS domain S-box-containing protein